jgi:hypothetical protein
MSTQTTPTASAPTFTPAQWRVLHTLRAHYRQDHDLFSERERAHLYFLRWLCHTGRLVP